MTSLPHRPSRRSHQVLRRVALLVLGLGACGLMVLGSQLSARAAFDTIVLEGSLDADDFLVTVDPADSGRLLFCAEVCFTRARTEVGAVTVRGLDGDDSLTVHHAADLVTNSTGDLPVSFNGGPGDDRLEVCGATGLVPCALTVGSSVRPGASADERILTHSTGGRSVTVTINDVGSVLDVTPGAAQVVGSPVADDIRYDQQSVGTGVVTVGAAPYAFRNKASLTLDGGTGQDRFDVLATAGLDGSTSTCGPLGARVCLVADGQSDDNLSLAARSGQADQVQLLPGASGTSASGLVASPPFDLVGIDHVDLSIQSGEDSVSYAGTAGDDSVTVTAAANGLTVAARLALDAAPFDGPTLDVTGSGEAPVDVSVAGGEGDDQLGLVGTNGDDQVAVTRGGPSVGCVEAGATCVELSGDSSPGGRVTLRGVERHLLEVRDGDDTLAVDASLSSTTTWRGGEGADSAIVTGSGPVLTVGLAGPSVQQVGAGPIHLSSSEHLSVAAGGGSVTTTVTTGDDELEYKPTGPSSGAVVLQGGETTVDLTGVGGTNRLDLLGGDDTVRVIGTTAADVFAVGRSAELSAQVNSLLPVRLAGTESTVLRALGGNDRFLVTGSAAMPHVTADGGIDAAGDTVDYAEAKTDVEVSVDDDLGTGQLDADGSAIALLGIEQIQVEGDAAHRITVSGSDSPDSITQLANTVTVDRTTSVTFAGFPNVSLIGGAADDQLWVEPATLTGVQSLAVDGAGSHDVLSLAGTALSEQIRYTPDTATSGTIELPLTPPVHFLGIDETLVDGRTTAPSGDRLVVATPTLDGTLVLRPGASVDSGSVEFQELAGPTLAASPLAFAGLGRGELWFDGDPAAPADRVVLHGEGDSDAVVVTTRATADGPVAATTIDQRVPVVTPGAQTLSLLGSDGDDLFRLPTDHPVPGAGGPGILVAGDGPEPGDRLVLTGGGQALVVDEASATTSESGHAAVSHGGVSRIDLDAAEAGLTVTGGDGPDSLNWLPTGPQAGRVAAPGSPDLYATRLGGMRIDPVAGADQVTVTLRSVVDVVTIDRGTTTQVDVTGLQSLQVASSVEALRVETGDAADELLVRGSGGPGAFAVNGGAPTTSGDRLRLESADATVAFGPDPDSGVLESPGGAVQFSELETVDVQGAGTGQLAVRGNDGPESFTIGETVTPRVRVGGAADVTYAGFPDVALLAEGGDDDVLVGFAGLGDIDRLVVDSGTGRDGATVADTSGSTRTFTVTPTHAGGGTVVATDERAALTLVGTESLAVDGRGGDDRVSVVTPAGSQDVRVVPGSVVDAGDVRVGSLQPLSFQDLGGQGAVAIVDADGARVDTLTLEGSAASASTTLDGPEDQVRRVGWLPLETTAALDLAVPGYDGDDAVEVIGPLPYRTTTVDGGSPDLGDRLSLEGPVADVRVDLGGATVVGYGGEVRFPGVASLVTDAGGRGLTQVGTSRDDALCYDPMSPRDGRLYIVGAPAGGSSTSVCLPDQRGTNVLHTFVEVGSLVVDPGEGSDEVIVNGTTSRDLITVQAHAPLTEVAVHPEPSSGSTFRLPLQAVVETTESVVVAADNGSDTIDVSAYDSAAPLITVYGESPATMKDADQLVFRDATGAGHLSDVNSQTKGSGTVLAEYRKGSGAIIRVDYVDVEAVTLVRDPKAG